MITKRGIFWQYSSLNAWFMMVYDVLFFTSKGLVSFCMSMKVHMIWTLLKSTLFFCSRNYVNHESKRMQKMFFLGFPDDVPQCNSSSMNFWSRTFAVGHLHAFSRCLCTMGASQASPPKEGVEAVVIRNDTDDVGSVQPLFLPSLLFVLGCLNSSCSEIHGFIMFYSSTSKL